MSSGELSHVEKAHLAEALQWHGLPPSTLLHLAPDNVVDGIVSLRVATSLGDSRSPADLQRAHALAKQLMLAHSKRIAARRYKVKG